MHKRSRSRAALRVAVAGAVVSLLTGYASGGITYSNSSTAKFTHDIDNTTTTTALKLSNILPPAQGSMPAPPSYQYNQTITQGSASSQATGSVGHITNATTATFTLAPGTGVTQNDPSNTAPGYSVLRLDLDGFWTATAPSFGPAATGYLSITVGGVVGTGGSAQFQAQLDFLNAANNQPLREQINFSRTWNTAGAFSRTFTSSALLGSGSLPTATQLRVKGFIEFRASNDRFPTSIAPINFDIGGAPPTAAFNTTLGSWQSAANWALGNNVDVDPNGNQFPAIPNAIGDRARFVASGIDRARGQIREVFLEQNTKLGTLDIQEQAVYIRPQDGLQGDGGDPALQFDVKAGEAVIYVGATYGDAYGQMAYESQLFDNLEIVTEGQPYRVGRDEVRPTAIFEIDGRIVAQGNQSVTKRGEGRLIINSSNNVIPGGFFIEGGVVEANQPSSLGNATVTVNNAVLFYNQNRASGADVAKAINCGEIILGIVPGAGDVFEITSEGAITGSFNQLAALDAGAGGNLILEEGAMIGHNQGFDTGAAGNPANLGNTPRYVFGIGRDFVTGNIDFTVGEDAGGFWKGFGSDRFDQTFGPSPNSSNYKLNYAGDGDLVALGGTLRLNAILNASSDVTVTKRGCGTVDITNVNNTFFGTMNVIKGTLKLSGNLPGGTINVRENATLRGAGSAPSTTVTIEGFGHLAPGDGPGTFLTVGDLILTDAAQLDYELGNLNATFDAHVKSRDLVLDGILNVTDLGGFDEGTSWLLIEYSGNIVNNGLELGLVPPGYPLSVVVIPNPGDRGGRVLLVIPEPGSLSMLALGCLGVLRRRRR
jgi:hypothetical protein